MPIDPSIYQNVGRVNLGQGLSSILDEQRARDAARLQQQNTLAALAMQQEAATQKLQQPERPVSWSTIETDKGYVQVNPITGELRELGISRPVKPESEPQPYFSPVQTGQGIYAFNARTGRVEPILVGGKPMVGAQADVGLQEQLAGAKEKGKSAAELKTESAKAIKRSDQMLTLADEARSLLMQKPTGSILGAAADVAAGAVGYSPQSAKLAERLKTLSGWMVSNVPRMEGPQSNVDVENYKIMAGRVGDNTIPAETRLAALDELVRLQNKYKNINQGTPSATAAVYDAEKEARYQAWKAQQGVK